MKDIFKYVALGVTAILLTAIFPIKGNFNNLYKKGDPWIYETLVAQMDFPILKSETEIYREKEEKASSVIDCYLFDEHIEHQKSIAFEKEATEKQFDNRFVEAFRTTFSKVMKAGLVSGFEEENISDKIIFVKKDKRVKEQPATDVFTKTQAIDEFKKALYSHMAPAQADSLINLYHPETFFGPNLIYDKASTEQFHKEAVDYISPTKGMVYSGQLIVSNGELVTGEIEQMLDSYKAEYERVYGLNGYIAAIVASHFIFVIILLGLLVACLSFTNKRLLQSKNKLLFILTMITIQFAGTAILSQFGESWVLIFPYAAVALYLFSFFNNKTAFPIYIISILPILVMCNQGVTLFFINLASGTVTMAAAYYFNRGWKQFLNALLIFAAMFLVYITGRIAGSMDDALIFGKDVLFMGVSAILVVMLYPFAFLFEKMFSLVSHSRLWELSDTNSELLREMARLAPGSFQHSLQVALLAEEATRQVGGYPMLARVGALYHDIGKMENPVCFVENQIPGVSVDYHHDLSPEASAKDIMKHVEDGMALARKNGLPEVVSDFIITHHGQTIIKYFYTMYCNNGGSPAEIDKFKYQGRLPQSKEQAIVMMADSIEAASRTLKSYSAENISQLVDKLVEGKMEEGQFNEADITLKEISIAKESFKTFLQQIYHARITYPKRKRAVPQETESPQKELQLFQGDPHK